MKNSHFLKLSGKKGIKMEKRTTVNLDGRNIEGAELNFKSLKEEWNEYQCEDGTILRLKVVVSEVFRLDEYDPDGKPRYLIKSSNVLSASVPETLKKGATKVRQDG
jgi:hypothetical protein